MDISAVLNANDDTLKDMGLSTAAPLKRSNTRKKRNPKDEDYDYFRQQTAKEKA